MTIVIKKEFFGSITLGACTVSLINKGQTYEIRVSQGTSCRYTETPDASYAHELFAQRCEEALREHGPLVKPQGV